MKLQTSLTQVSCRYHMAQTARFSAQENRTDIEIPVPWACANVDPPWQDKIWLEHLLMAVTVKGKVNPEIMYA